MTILIAFCLFAYVLGSLPTAIIYAKTFHGIDIRQHGSGNAGATNSMRVMGKKAGIIVLLIDVLKGFLVVYLFYKYQNTLGQAFLVGLCAVLGHILSVFSGFKGGKGIATSLGVILAIFPMGAFISICVFVSVVFLSKYVSLGSLLAGVSFASILTYLHPEDMFLLSIAWSLVILLIFTHRTNIVKILNGTENKFPPKK